MQKKEKQVYPLVSLFLIISISLIIFVSTPPR